MNRVALIPSFEPGEALVEIVRDLYDGKFRIVVVDDGSGDEYKNIFDRISDCADLISYKENKGKGYALRTGLEYIKNNYPNYMVVTMDSDGQHTVNDAVKLCNEVEKTPASFLIGSRVLPKSAPLKSRLGNSITRFVYKAVTNVPVYDTQSGLRAFGPDWLPLLLTISGDRYEYEMNVLLKIAGDGLPIREVPIETIYLDKKNSVSHFNAFSDSFKIYKEIFKFAGSSFIGFLVDYAIYSILVTWLGGAAAGIVIANYSARAVSSVLNFALNKCVVFKSKGNLKSEAARYFALVLFNITLNTLILSGLTALGGNRYVCKIIVEIVMFFLNFVLQRTFIFKKLGESGNSNGSGNCNSSCSGKGKGRAGAGPQAE